MTVTLPAQAHYDFVKNKVEYLVQKGVPEWEARTHAEAGARVGMEMGMHMDDILPNKPLSLL